ncbi:hypothetical protein ACLOJK_035159 [Asimina triloba]
MEHDSKVWEQNLVERFWGSFVRWADSIRPLGQEEGERQGVSEWGGVGQQGESRNSILVAGTFGGEQQVGVRHLKKAHSAIMEFGGPFGLSELRRVGRANSGQAGKMGQTLSTRASY